MSKKIMLLWVFTALFTMYSCKKQPVQKVYNQGINITPKPLELTQNEGFFELSNKVEFVVDTDSLTKIAAFFADKIKNSTGYDLSVSKEKVNSNYISLNIAANIPVNDEGYLLEVTPKGVNIQAKTLQGAFYGMQTVMQLLPAEIESSTLVDYIDWKVPCVKIKDEPRFSWRGQHLDVCRHFFGVDYIKKQLDVLAMFKMNKFHWHLTDDQGWRIESKKYPKINDISTKRIEGDGSTYGPFFYTQDQIKEVVAYAKERFIEVIPEVELPGHGVAALAAYPQFACTQSLKKISKETPSVKKPLEVRNVWGVSDEVYCAGNDSTFQFLTNVIEEILPLFPSQYFHIGGDECPKTAWQNCPKCQARIKALGIKGTKQHSAEEQLQSYFVQRIEKVLLKNHKKMIGWDEILEGGLAPSATVMSWRGEQGGIDAANMGHDVIMTPGNWLYLDHFQDDPKISPVTIGGYTTLEKTYSYDPLPKELDKEKENHILGAQANVWSEYIHTPELAERKAYPRVIALAELTWTTKENKDYKDFERRIDNELVRLDEHKINYYIPQPDQVTPSCNFVAFMDSAKLAFKTTRPVKMVYTTDGSEPTLSSTVYTEPLSFTTNTTLKIRTVLVSDKMGDVRTITIEKQSCAPAIKEAIADKRLKIDYYKIKTTNVSDLNGKTIEKSEYVAAPQKAKFPDSENYSAIATGYINIPADGVYYFSTDQDEFWLDGKLFINNGKDLKRFSHHDKSIALQAGYHSIKIVHLSNIIDGWPSYWNAISVSIRPDKDDKFKVMDESFYK